ncbi:MAG: arginine--tRNA ligase [Nitrososphaeria archaeon]
MPFKTLKKEVRELIEKALKELGYPTVDFLIQEPPSLEFGELSSNVAFEIAKKMGKPPYEIASNIALRIMAFEKKLVKEVSAAQPGYLNFKVNKCKYFKIIVDHLLNGKPGYTDLGKGKKVIVEHTSVNPNKALHIGHLRNVVIGDIIHRLLKYTNHEVVVLNYIDDSGAQVADIIVGFKFLGFPENPPKPNIKFDQYCGDYVYVKVNQIYSQDPETENYRRVVLKELENPESETYKFARNIIEKVLIEQLKTCSEIEAYYDCLNFESHIIFSNTWKKIFEQLKEKNLIVYASEGKNVGCWVYRDESGQEKVIIRSDGTATYIAKDILYAAWKLGLVEDFFNYEKFFVQKNGKILWRTTIFEGESDHPTFNNAELAINVIDIRQAWLQNIISEILRKFVGKESDKRYIHLGYEVVSLSRDTAKEIGIEVGDKEFVHMSGRSGMYINADTVLEKLHKLAYEETMKRNPEADEKWLNEIAHSIAVSALRYSLIRQDLGKILVFDLKEALKLEGDTGPYLQYTYARAYNIIEKYGKIPEKVIELDKLVEDDEYLLLIELSKISEKIEEAVAKLQPNKIAEYAHKLCLYFNTFYEKHPVLHEKDQSKREQRILLVYSFTRALKTLMELLGIEAHKRI